MRQTAALQYVPQTVLDDLSYRLAHTRWPQEIEGIGWDYGTDRDTLQQLVGYWRDEYDWRKQEAELNRFAWFETEIDAAQVRFIYQRGKGPHPTPILLFHGWPDSYYRYHKLIPMLTDPAAYGADPTLSFDVVVAALHNLSDGGDYWWCSTVVTSARSIIDERDFVAEAESVLRARGDDHEEARRIYREQDRAAVVGCEQGEGLRLLASAAPYDRRRTCSAGRIASRRCDTAGNSRRAHRSSCWRARPRAALTKTSWPRPSQPAAPSCTRRLRAC